MDKKLVSLIIPIYNEESHLEDFCRQLFSYEFGSPIEYIFVDDGSSDKSHSILEQFKDKPGVVIHHQGYNQGKGAALSRGIQLAKGGIVAIQDADFEYDPNDLRQLIEKIQNDEADVVYGSRFMQQSPKVHRTYHYLGNRILTLLSNLLSGLYLSDMETCYKVFRSEIIKGLHLECKRFGFEPEVTAKLATLKIRIHEYSISYNPRNYSDGKKIGWRDGVAAIWYILARRRLSSH
ncbi:MAG: glycosyltransferase family 2 protein [Oligoflexales bacterium]